jgi:hypothetical protein
VAEVSFNVGIKCGRFMWQGASQLDGYCMRVEDTINETPDQSIPPTGKLVYGRTPYWFRGVLSYDAGGGIAIITNKSEGTITGTIVVKCTVGGLTITQTIGSVVDMENEPYPGRYYLLTYSGLASFVDATNSGETLDVKITCLTDADAIGAEMGRQIDQGFLAKRLTTPIGHDAPNGMYKEMVK